MQYILEDDELKSNWERCVCGNLAEMQEICQGSLYDDNDGNDFYYTFYAYKVLRCPSCHAVSVIRYAASGNEIDDEYDSRINGPKTREYTRDVLHTTYRKELRAVPEPIADVFNQAQAVIASSLTGSILCVVQRERIFSVLIIYPRWSTKMAKKDS